MVSRSLLATSPLTDPGSEGALGYDYQCHIGARKCIEMLSDKDVEYVVCEFREDILQVRRDLKLELCQVKKRESGAWSLHDLIAPDKKQRDGILGKLFYPIQQGMDVHRLNLIGCGRVSASSDRGCSLPGLIDLLRAPTELQDAAWAEDLGRYENYLGEALGSQGVGTNTVAKSLRILRIDFALPFPEAIHLKNLELLDEVIQTIWQVNLELAEVRDIYQLLYGLVRTASVKTRQPWIEKAISRGNLTTVVTGKMKEYTPVPGHAHLLTLQEKLALAHMGAKVPYAVEKRLNAMQLKYELEIRAASWESYRTTIDKRWRQFRQQNPTLQGPDLWEALRDLLSELGDKWSQEDPRMDRDFTEGVFFDMTGICEASWELQHA
jgi:hypothetical protein